ncbi:MAG: hypothetical protein M8357_04760 [Desulfobulbaceae bacterium]|nr:hypothetical protein [Desulfobulbaceae bacterium]
MVALKFLGSSLVNQLLQKELEKYKSQLQEKTTYLKTSLSIYAEEQNIANQRIDNQKAEAIHKIYSSMCDISYPLSRIIAGTPFVTEDDYVHINFYREHAENAHTACSSLSSLLINHAIYFDETTYKQISDYSTEVANIIAKFLKILRQGEAEGVISQEQLISILEEKRIEIGKAFDTVDSHKIIQQ